MKQPHSIFYPLITGADNPLLRRISDPVTAFDREIQTFSDILLELMYEYDGIGLAAPQLGEALRMIAVTEWKERKEKKGKNGKLKVHRSIIGEYVMINPVLLEHSTQTQITEEACLSLPRLFGEVERYAWVKVSYFDPQGNAHTKKLQGFNAVVVQHEMDHLEGILFTDKLIEPL